MKKEVIELTRKASDFSEFEWVIKAVSTDPNRKILQTVHVETDPVEPAKSIVVATDGRRLHAAKLTGTYTPGNYRVLFRNIARMILMSDEDSGNYPAWQTVVPKCESKDMTKIESNKERGMRGFLVAIACHKLNGTVFNLDYLLDAVGALLQLYAHQVDTLSPILIRDYCEN